MTHYTYKVAPINGGESCSFEEFVWHCAKGFKLLDANYDLRSNSDDIDRYRKFIIEYQQDLEHYKSASGQELLDEIQLRNADIIQKNIEFSETNEAYRSKYSKMLQKVQDWAIPDESFIPFKDFMVEQLTISLNDCVFTPMKTKRLDPNSFRESQFESRKISLEYYQEQLKSAENIPKRDSRWVEALKESVSPPTKRSNNNYDAPPPF